MGIRWPLLSVTRNEAAGVPAPLPRALAAALAAMVCVCALLVAVWWLRDMLSSWQILGPGEMAAQQGKSALACCAAGHHLVPISR